MNVTVRFDTPLPAEPAPDNTVVVAEPGRWGWAHLPHPDGSIAQIHLMPTYDCGMHAFDTMCRCRPVETSPGFVAHNAFDGREDYEPTPWTAPRRKKN